MSGSDITEDNCNTELHNSSGEMVSDEKYQRFKIITEEEEHQWSIPEGMEAYIRENFERYIPEKKIKEAILTRNPRPNNLVPVKKLDEYLHTLMKEKRKYQELTVEATLKKIQNRNLDVMGPLAKLWLAVDKVTNHVEDENPPKLPIEEAQQLLEQSIMMLGQTNNLLLYERRKNVLSSVMNNTKGSSTLKEQAEVLSKSSDTYCLEMTSGTT